MNINEAWVPCWGAAVCDWALVCDEREVGSGGRARSRHWEIDGLAEEFPADGPHQAGLEQPTRVWRSGLASYIHGVVVLEVVSITSDK